LSLISRADEFIISGRTDITWAPAVKFIIDDDYLITHVLAKATSSHGQFKADLVTFAKLAWRLDQEKVEKLSEYADCNPLWISRPEFLNEFANFLNTLKATPEYAVIKEETINYMKDSVEEWNSNLEKSVAFVTKYSGFSFNFGVTAYITHPGVGNGAMHDRNLKIISFGAVPDFPNYFSVYIWHEIIHTQMPYDDVSHSVNQLLTDNDLRVELGDKSLYPLQGHPALEGTMEKLMPAWQEYKKNPTNLNDFVRSLPPPEPQPPSEQSTLISTLNQVL
jgi:hypothetical protein